MIGPGQGDFVLIREGMPRGMGALRFPTLERAKMVHDIARQNGRARYKATVRGPNNYAEECGPHIGDRWIRIYEDRRKRQDEPIDEESVDG